mgnify:CR=1 FL=1
MNLREILLAIQYMCIIGVFAESVVIVKRWKNSLHLYLLLSCIVALLNYVGYLLELTAGTKEEFITALKFSYIGRVWYAFFLFLFVAELTQVGVTKVLKYLLILIHAGTYGVILTIPNHRLYYTEIEILNLVNYKVSKLTGYLDYSLLRHSKTELSKKEIMYCINDVLVVMAYIQERIESDGDITLIPLTKTGYVRNYCKVQCLGKGKKKNKRYKTIMKGLTLNSDEYRQLDEKCGWKAWKEAGLNDTDSKDVQENLQKKKSSFFQWEQK